MRVVNLVIVASGFAIIFLGIALVSALFTSVVHSQLQSRSQLANTVLRPS